MIASGLLISEVDANSLLLNQKFSFLYIYKLCIFICCFLFVKNRMKHDKNPNQNVLLSLLKPTLNEADLLYWTWAIDLVEVYCFLLLLLFCETESLNQDLKRYRKVWGRKVVFFPYIFQICVNILNFFNNIAWKDHSKKN